MTLLVLSKGPHRYFTVKKQKPINLKSSEENPLELIAAITDETPGIGETIIFFLCASEITISPGSDIDGVPASDTKAISFPSKRSLIK